MKKRLLSLLFGFILLVCPILVGCASDPIIGSWNIKGYYYNLGGQEKYVSLEEAAAIVYDDTVVDQTSEKAYLNAIKYVEDARHLTIFEFKEEGVLMLTGAEFTWERVDENTVTSNVAGQTKFVKDGGKLRAEFPTGGIIIYLLLER